MDTINSEYGRVAATQRTRRRCWSHPETVSESCAIPSQSSQDEDEVLNGIRNLITFAWMATEPATAGAPTTTPPWTVDRRGTTELLTPQAKANRTTTTANWK